MDYNNFDLNLIKVFINVYETKSISLASQKMYVSQPAITNSIKRLENYLNVKLFVRTPKGVYPTKEGDDFNKYCYNIMQMLEVGISKIKSLANLEEGYLNIGSSSTIIRKILISFIEYFNKKYPNIVISITDANSEKLVKYLKLSIIDVAIINMPIENEDEFAILPILKTHDCFITNADSNITFISKLDLKNQKLILQKRPSSNRDYFEKMCVMNNVSYKPSFEIGSFGLITDFVSKNMGIGYVIKEFVEDEIKSKKIKELQTDFISYPRDIAIITKQITTNNLVTKKFIDEFSLYVKNKDSK